MRKLLIYLKPYAKESILGPLFKLIEAALELCVPFVMAAMIDRGVQNADSPYILRMGILLVGLAAVGLICSVTAQWFAARAAVGFAADVRHALFERVGQLSYSQLDRQGSATLITRLTSDVNQLQNGVNLTLRLFLRSPFVVFGAMAAAFCIDVRAALVFAVVIPVLCAVVFWILLVTLPRYGAVQEKLDGVLRTARENLSGVRVIRAFSQEERQAASFRRQNDALADAQLEVGRISVLMNPMTYVLLNFALAVLIYVGAWRVDTGALTQGLVVALVNYMLLILTELVKMANLIVTMTRAAASGRRVQQVLALPARHTGGDVTRGKQDAPAISFSHVSMRYDGAAQDCLHDLNFQIQRGQTVGIIGATGAGKSTLVQMIGGYYLPREGSVSVEGVDVQDWDEQALRHKIALVPQRAALLRGSIRENLCMGQPDADEAALREALDMAQATEFVMQRPGGLDAQVEQGARNLSGGQRQRLTIARALVRRAPILILDDSMSALDYATDAALRQAIASSGRQQTVVLVSQRTASVQNADLIVVLEEGRIAGMGTHETLLRDCQVYREIYLSQHAQEETA